MGRRGDLVGNQERSFGAETSHWVSERREEEDPQTSTVRVGKDGPLVDPASLAVQQLLSGVLPNCLLRSYQSVGTVG